MNDILLATIPAVIVLIAMLSVRFLEHHLQSKREAGRQELERERETRDAKRRYRENIATPAREALNKVQTNLASRDFVNTVFEADKQRISLKPETRKDIEMLNKLQRWREVKNMDVTLTKLLPLAGAITNKEARKL